MNELLEKIKLKLKEEIVVNKKERNKFIDIHAFLADNRGLSKKPMHYTLLRNINETYNLGVDMTCSAAEEAVIKALDNLIKLLDYEIEEDERIIATIENGFNSYVCNIPFMFLNIFINMFFKIDVSEIFLKQLQANKVYYQNNSEMLILTYQDEKFDGLKDYELKILEAFEARDFARFKELVLEYFRYFYKSKTITKLLKKADISVKEMLAKVDDLIEAMRIKFFSQKKEIPKEMVNVIRNIIDKTIRENNASIENMLKEIQNIKKLHGKPKIDVIMEFNRVYKLNLKMTADYDTIVIALKEAIEIIRLDIAKIRTLRNAISRNGIDNAVLGLPRLMFTIEDKNLLVQYLVLMGIKINGETSKSKIDSLEKQLHDYEIQLAKLINDDYSISRNNKEEFLKLYVKYLELYANYIDSHLVNDNGSKATKNIKGIVHNMNLYIDNANAWLVQDDVPKPLVVSKPAVKEIVVNPLQEYIQNGVVVKYVSLDYFKELLNASHLSIYRQEEYMKQMANFKNRNIDNILKELLGEFLEEEELVIYLQAKESSNAEIKQVVHDIEAAATLILESKKEEAEELQDECRDYIGILRKKLKNENINFDDIPKVLYFKTSNNAPYILEGLEKNYFKQVRISLNKIITGKLDGDKEIKGLDSLLQFRAKGKNKKVVYTIINGVTIIIGAFNDSEIPAMINEIITSKEFLSYINEILGFIKIGRLPDEREYTNNINELLSGKPNAQIK